MRFGLFYEHQLPRPWKAESEHDLLHDALAQVALADRLGFDYAWAVEHHFLEEYSHSSAPEVFLGAASQRTQRIRLGHGIVALPQQVNHPARVAERVATLDLLAKGRVDFGTGESSSAAELGGFGVRRSAKREQWLDALDAITRMFVEEPFAGWDSPWLRMPPRNVVPKPLQKPHPPLWVACSQRDTIHLAARNGLGALSFSFAEPEQAARWVREYYELIASEECQPAGFAVNANVAVVLPMMCHRDERTAIERGAPGAAFFAHALSHYYGLNPHAPGRTDIGARFAEQRERRQHSGTTQDNSTRALSRRIIEAGTGSMRGAIGTPGQVRELLHGYADAGVDQVIFVMQAGATRHEHICESMELFAAEVMPAFATDRARHEAAKAQRLAPAVTAALARRSPPRCPVGGYRIDERAEIATLDPTEPGARPKLGAHLATRASRRTSRLARGLPSELTRHLSDRQLEGLVARPGAQRALLSLLTQKLRPERARDFDARVKWRLTLSDGAHRDWTLCIRDGRAELHPGTRAEPTMAISVPAVLLARVASGELNPVTLAESPAIEVDGDLTRLPRLAYVLGAPSPF